MSENYKRDKTKVKRGKHGKWLPGTIANPGGRPKSIANMVRNHTGNGEMLIKKAIGLLEAKSKLVVLETIKWLVERGWGKTESVSIDELGNETKYDIRTVILMELAKRQGYGNIENQPPREIVETQQLLHDPVEEQGAYNIQDEPAPIGDSGASSQPEPDSTHNA